MPGMDHDAINERCARDLLAWLDQQASGNQVRQAVNLGHTPGGPVTSADPANCVSENADDSAAGFK